MLDPEEPPFCKPLLHHLLPPQPRPPADVDPASCHVHIANICPVHGLHGDEGRFLAAPNFDPRNHARVSVACSASIASPRTHGEDEDHDHDDASHWDRASLAIDTSREDEVESEGEDRRDDARGGSDDDEGAGEGLGSWSAARPEDDLKKACERLCEQMHWKSEKQYQEVARSSFHCQSSLKASHEANPPRREAEDGRNGCHAPLRAPSRSMLSLHSPFSDATFARPVRECRKERPMSAPVHERIRRIRSSPRRGQLVPEDLLQRYSAGGRAWTQGRKGGGVVKPRDDAAVPLHLSPSMRSVEQFRSKSVEARRPRFCTGVNRGKGETMMPDDGGKKMLKVLPVIALHRDKAKSVWNRKATQKEWDAGHRGCCSQHWVSLLDKNEKVCPAEGRKVPTLSPSPRAKFAEIATQKLQVQGERCRIRVGRSLDFSSSPLASLKSIVDDMSRPQSASLPKRISDTTPTGSTPRSSSTCRSSGKPSVAVPLPLKLKKPELNSSAWLLAKMEALKNEAFSEPKAFQIAKEHGIVLDKEDEAALKKFLQSEQSPSPERLRNTPREKYFNLCNISTPAESSVAADQRKTQKQLEPRACAVGIQARPDQFPQVFPQPGDLNMKNLDDELDWSAEEASWIERCRETHTTTIVCNSCHT